MDFKYRVGILSVFRDEERSLGSFLGFLSDLEKESCSCQFYYSFYENDSIDNTVSILREWLISREGDLISEQLNETRYYGCSLNRVQRLSEARNLAIIPLYKMNLDYILIVDAGIQMNKNHFSHLMKAINKNEDAVMVCSSAIQNVPDVLGEFPWSYYDSWALKDLEGNRGITFAANPFLLKKDRYRWMAGLPVSVSSCFGGMALIRLKLLLNNQVFWSSSGGCEHWNFCDELRKYGLIFACPNILPLVIHSHKIPSWSIGYAEYIKNKISKI